MLRERSDGGLLPEGEEPEGPTWGVGFEAFGLWPRRSLSDSPGAPKSAAISSCGVSLISPFNWNTATIDFASAFVQVSEIVRPAHLARRERLRVEVTRLGGIVVFGGLENHSELAVRRGEIGRSNGAVHLPRQCGVALACLRLHGLVHPREIRQRNRQQFLA